MRWVVEARLAALVVPAHAGTQHATAYPCHCERSEAIHLSACRGMDCFVARAPRNDGGYSFAFSRHEMPEVLQIVSPSSIQRAQGMPDARCTRGLMCDVHSRTCT